MDKGTRVKIVKGRKAIGMTGTVFWIGDNKWGEGKRAGIEGDDGETYWISLENLEETNDSPPEIEAPEKGTRVIFTSEEGEEIEGEVFWSGESKSGRTVRLGVKDAEGETHWMDARKARPADAPAAEDIAAEDVPF
jgi:hypothetical protein